MGDFTDWIEQVFGLTPTAQGRIITTIIGIGVLWILHQVLMRVIARRTNTLETRYRLRKATSYALIAVGVILIGRTWFEGVQSLATYLGLLSAGLAIALQELVVSVAGWLFIMWRRPFQLGDRIQIGEHTGDVIDIDVLQFTLMEVGNWVDADQTTGRIIHIPTGQIFRQSQANYSQAFRYIWNETPIVITFESDWRKAKGLLEGIVLKHAEHLSEIAQQRLSRTGQRFMISQPRLTPSVYTSVAESGVRLTLRYLCEPAERRDKAQSIWEDVLDAFDQHADIEFAYPTQREIQTPDRD